MGIVSPVTGSTGSESALALNAVAKPAPNSSADPVGGGGGGGGVTGGGTMTTGGGGGVSLSLPKQPARADEANKAATSVADLFECLINRPAYSSLSPPAPGRGVLRYGKAFWRSVALIGAPSMKG